MTDFSEESYHAHQKWFEAYSRDKDPHGGFSRFYNTQSINYWRHQRMYRMVHPFFIDKSASWLTIGDYIGTDAHYLLSNGIGEAVASDISSNLLAEAADKGLINKYKAINAENINLDDDSFDFILCKEAFHHFPKAYVGLYEMIRVSRKAVIIIEPVDIAIHFPFLIFLKNILDRFNTHWINRVWKNRFSFEEVGNYVFKISERELEKIAMGLNLPMVAWKGFNDYYSEDVDLEEKTDTPLFSKVKRKILLRNLLCRVGIIPYKLMVGVVFKEMPDEQLLSELKKAHYRIIPMMRNPHI